jgi:hypothetical protein
MLDIEKMYNATPSHAAAEAGDNKEFPRGSRKHSKCYYPVYYVSWFDAILFCNIIILNANSYYYPRSIP